MPNLSACRDEVKLRSLNVMFLQTEVLLTSYKNIADTNFHKLRKCVCVCVLPC